MCRAKRKETLSFEKGKIKKRQLGVSGKAAQGRASPVQGTKYLGTCHYVLPCTSVRTLKYMVVYTTCSAMGPCRVVSNGVGIRERPCKRNDGQQQWWYSSTYLSTYAPVTYGTYTRYSSTCYTKYTTMYTTLRSILCRWVVAGGMG